jgi:uridine phosphorylase
VPDVRPNDLVVPTGCVRDEGTSLQYVELGFPSVPDILLTTALLKTIGEREIRWHAGIVHCKDAYYLEHANRQLMPDVVAQRWQALRRAGVLATEMESSILFVLGSLRRFRAASVLISVGIEPDQKGFQLSLDEAVASVSHVFASLGPPTWTVTDSSAGDRDSYLEIRD